MQSAAYQGSFRLKHGPGLQVETIVLPRPVPSQIVLWPRIRTAGQKVGGVTRCANGEREREKESQGRRKIRRIVRFAARSPAYFCKLYTRPFELHREFAYSLGYFYKGREIVEGSLSRNDTLAATCWSDDNISFAVIRGSIRAALIKRIYLELWLVGVRLVSCFPFRFFPFFSFRTEQVEIPHTFRGWVNCGKLDRKTKRWFGNCIGV